MKLTGPPLTGGPKSLQLQLINVATASAYGLPLSPCSLPPDPGTELCLPIGTHSTCRTPKDGLPLLLKSIQRSTRDTSSKEETSAREGLEMDAFPVAPSSSSAKRHRAASGSTLGLRPSLTHRESIPLCPRESIIHRAPDCGSFSSPSKKGFGS